MKSNKVSLFLFIDAMGWELVERFPHFLASIAPVRKRLKTIFGYSSACDPSIISGLMPSEHGLWSSFYYSPELSPFRPFQWMKVLPSFIADNHRVRSRISRYVASRLEYTGYVQLYNVPFKYLQYFDYAEKKRIYAPNGLPQGRNIFDVMVEAGIPYHMAAPNTDDLTKINTAIEQLNKGEISLAYLTLGQLDALMHKVGTTHPKVSQLLEWYERHLERIVQTAKQNYEEVSVYVFADHGMHDTIGSFDLQKEIIALGLDYGTDYAAMYDSTMARFWYLNDRAQERILSKLQDLPVGRVLSDKELQNLGVFFPDRRYGETIFLLNSSMMIAPSFMGQKQIPGMHGYHPDDAESCAAMLSNQELPEELHSIHHIFNIMQSELQIKQLITPS
ncbi:MAG: alkaline phosphatase family protein [Chlamydiales bacterium]|nr:alkaline phosphatase family protein [Chlamydiales bacterium]